jgi:gluconokinase
MHALVGLDADGVPITNIVTWADQRAAGEAAALKDTPEGLELHRRTGTPVHPMSPLLKLRWFAQHEPDVFARVRTWVGVKELVLRELVGEVVVDHGVASATGLLNLETLDWDDEALACAGITAEHLPRLVAGTEVVDGHDLPVVVGGADGPLANLGLGAVTPGTVACSIGTSGALRVAADRPAVDPRGRVFSYVLAPGRFVVGGAINNGGVVLEWLREAVAPDLDVEAVLDLAAQAPAGSADLLFLPYLHGERAPHWRPGARGGYVGLTGEHRREHLLRAPLEGVCLQLALVLHAMQEAGVEPTSVRATGGFSRSPLWRSILASALNRPIGFARSPEGSALGAALLGFHALGHLDDLDEAANIVDVAETEEPVARDAETYAQLLPIFDEAALALDDTFDQISSLRNQLH